MKSRATSGFTLIEVLVTALIVMFVLVMLARSMDLVTRTVTGEYRQLEIARTLETAHRVMRQDVEAMVKSLHWQFHASTAEGEPALAFLRYRLEAPGDQATEWVQYWREKHPEEPDRLVQWVRYSGPAENRLDTPSEWWEEVEPSDLDREVVLDDALSVDISVMFLNVLTEDVSMPASLVEMLEIRLATTTTPYAVMGDAPENLFEWVQAENGGWIEFRLRPEASP